MHPNDAVATLMRADINGPRALETLSAVAGTAGQVEANRVLQQWLAQPITAPAALAQAAVMVSFRRTDVAVLILEAALAVLPDHIQLLDHLANALVRRADRARAVALWQSWTDRHPDDAMGWYKLGYHLIDHGGMAASVAALERARTLAPDMTAAVTNLYTACTLAGHPSAALLDAVPPSERMVCYRTCGVFTA